MAMNYLPSYPEKFDLWSCHDLRPELRPWFYKRLATTDRLGVWKWLEEAYLRRYRGFYRVWPEWGADGIWGIPFPGSVSVRGAYDAADFQLSAATAMRMKIWHSDWAENYDPRRPGEFDWRTSDFEGFEVAKLVRLELDSSIYLEYHWFQELVLDEGEVVELPVPSFLLQFA